MDNSIRIKKYRLWRGWCNFQPDTFKLDIRFDEEGLYRVALLFNIEQIDCYDWVKIDELPPLDFLDNRRFL